MPRVIGVRKFLGQPAKAAHANTHTHIHIAAGRFTQANLRLLIRTQSGQGSLEAQKVEEENSITISVYLSSCLPVCLSISYSSFLF